MFVLRYDFFLESPPEKLCYHNSLNYDFFLESPQKKSATVPGPVWEPTTVPTLLIITLPLSFGNFSSTIAATAFASSMQADCEMKHFWS